MSGHTYRVTEIVGTSPDSVANAINNGIERASTTLRELDWFEVTEIRGHRADGRVAHFQGGLKVGCRREEPQGEPGRRRRGRAGSARPRASAGGQPSPAGSSPACTSTCTWSRCRRISLSGSAS